MTHLDPLADVHRSTSTRTRPRAAESTSTVPGRLVGKVVYLGPGPRLSRVEVYLGTAAGARRQRRGVRLAARIAGRLVAAGHLEPDRAREMLTRGAAAAGLCVPEADGVLSEALTTATRTGNGR